MLEGIVAFLSAVVGTICVKVAADSVKKVMVSGNIKKKKTLVKVSDSEQKCVVFPSEMEGASAARVKVNAGDDTAQTCAVVALAKCQQTHDPAELSAEISHLIQQAYDKKCIVQIDLDGTRGYSPSFIQQTFGSVARSVNNMDTINESVEFISEDEPSLPAEINRVMKRALMQAAPK